MGRQQTQCQITVTKEAARRAAMALAEEKKKVERAYRRPLERVMRQNAQDYPEGHPARRTLDYIGEGEEHLRFENYVGLLIDGGAITESAWHTRCVVRAVGRWGTPP